MKWLTLTEIGRRSRSKKGALKVSYESWNQRYKATADELLKALMNHKTEFGCKYCGLCRLYHPQCRYCPVGKSDIQCTVTGSLYDQAYRAFEGWRELRTVSSWWKWKRASKAMRDKLKELLDA